MNSIDILIYIKIKFLFIFIATIIPLIAIQNTTIAVSMQMRLQKGGGSQMNNEPMVILIFVLNKLKIKNFIIYININI